MVNRSLDMIKTMKCEVESTARKVEIAGYHCMATSVAVHILMVFLFVHGLNPNRNIPSVFPVLFNQIFSS